MSVSASDFIFSKFDISFNLNFLFLLQNLLSSIVSVFWDLGIADLIDSFKDIQKVLHAFYYLFEKWCLEDYKSLRKISNIGISLKKVNMFLLTTASAQIS